MFGSSLVPTVVFPKISSFLLSIKGIFRQIKISGEKNTPTGVGKTSAIIQRDKEDRKHPHRRGEDERQSKISA